VFSVYQTLNVTSLLVWSQSNVTYGHGVGRRITLECSRRDKISQWRKTVIVRPLAVLQRASKEWFFGLFIHGIGVQDEVNQNFRPYTCVFFIASRQAHLSHLCDLRRLTGIWVIVRHGRTPAAASCALYAVSRLAASARPRQSSVTAGRDSADKRLAQDSRGETRIALPGEKIATWVPLI